MRAVFEYISSGIFLPGGCGVPDPVRLEEFDYQSMKSDAERELQYRKFDMIVNLSTEERLEITRGAQDILCAIAVDDWEKMFAYGNSSSDNPPFALSPRSLSATVVLKQESVQPISQPPKFLFGALIPQ